MTLDRGPRSARQALTTESGWRYVVALVSFTVLGATVGAASLLQIGEPLLGILIAIILLRRGDDLAFMEYTFWLWIISPGLRRYVDYHSSYHPTSAILVAPYIMALCGFPVACSRQQVANWWIKTFFWVSFAAVVFATGVGVALDPSRTGVLADFLTWVPPLCFGFFLFMSRCSWQEIRETFSRITFWMLGILSAYGILQWYLVPPWDAAWLHNIGPAAISFGEPFRLKLRIWSLSNGPGAFAGVLSWLIVTSIALRKSEASRVRRLSEVIFVLLGVVTLGITNVRGAWITLVLAVLAIAWYGRASYLRFLLPTVATLGIVLLVGGPLAQTISSRASSFGSGTKDTSASARISFQSTALPEALRNPIGRGFGATGAGVRAGADAQTDAYDNTDSGYLTFLVEFGSVVGGILILTLDVACVRSYVGARAGDDLVVAWAALNLTVPISMLIGSSWLITMFVSLAGVARVQSGRMSAKHVIASGIRPRG